MDKTIYDAAMERQNEQSQPGKDAVASRSVIKPSKTELPIIAFGVVPMNLYRRINPQSLENPVYKRAFDEVIKSVWECGFNYAAVWGGLEQASLVMDACSNAKSSDGQKKEIHSIFLINPGFLTTYQNLDIIRNYFKDKTYPWAYLVMNLPRYNDWAQVFFGLEYLRDGDNTQQVFDTLCCLEWNKAITTLAYLSENDPERTSYLNFGVCYDSYDSAGKKWVNVMTDDGKPDRPRWSPFSAGSENTDQYIEAMQLMFEPRIWSFAFFPFRYVRDTSGNTGNTDTPPGLEGVPGSESGSYKYKLEKNYNMFYHNLEAFGRKAREQGKPLYAYCMCSSHGAWNRATEQYEDYYPKPTLGMLRFEAFNALAAGARGLVFWQYAMNDGTNEITEGIGTAFNEAPLSALIMEASAPNAPAFLKININYEDSELWKSVKTVIDDIRQVQHIFLESEVAMCGHFGGDGEIYRGLSKVTFPFGPVNSIGVGNSNIDDGVFMAWLTKKDESGNLLKEYLVVVNHNPFYSQNWIEICYSTFQSLTTVFGKESSWIPVDPSEGNMPKPQEWEKKKIQEDSAVNIPDTGDSDVRKADICCWIDLPPGGMHIFEVSPTITDLPLPSE